MTTSPKIYAVNAQADPSSLWAANRTYAAPTRHIQNAAEGQLLHKAKAVSRANKEMVVTGAVNPRKKVQVPEPLPPKMGEWVIAADKTTNADSGHVKSLEALLMQINGTSSGEITLQTLQAGYNQPPVYVATTSKENLSGKTFVNVVYLDQHGGAAKKPSSNGSYPVFLVNTQRLRDVFSSTYPNHRDFAWDQSTLDAARALTEMHSMALSMLKRRNQGDPDPGIASQWADHVLAAAEGDRMYGRLAGNSQNGGDFTHFLSWFLGGWRNMPGGRVMDAHEQVLLNPEATALLREAVPQLPKWLQFGMEAFESGGNRQSLLLPTLQLLDKRRKYSGHKNNMLTGFNLSPQSTSQLTTELFRSAIDASTGDPDRTAVKELTDAYKEATPYLVKVELRELGARAISAIEQGLSSNKYSPTDLANLLEGLQFDSPFQAKIDALLHRYQGRAQLRR